MMQTLTNAACLASLASALNLTAQRSEAEQVRVNTGKMGDALKATMDNIFKGLDADKDGSLDLEEVRARNGKGGDSTTEWLFSGLDKDGDGSVSESDFMNQYNDYYDWGWKDASVRDNLVSYDWGN